MSDLLDDGKRRFQLRSPPFPFINLEKAIDRAAKLLEYSKGHPVRTASAVTAWGYQPKSSGGIQTIAALKSFGLLNDSGSNDDRTVQISELGRRLLRNPPPDVRRQLLQQAALTPRVIGLYWGKWGANRPPDRDCLWELVDKRAFTEDAAAKFLSVYDSTISYAGFSDSDILSDEAEDMESDASVEELMMESGPQQQSQRPVRFAGGEAPNPEATVLAGARKAVFPLSEGDVTLIFPASLSPDALEELSDYLEIFLRKAKRENQKNEQPLNG